MRSWIGMLTLVVALTGAGPLQAQCGDCNLDGIVTFADALLAAEHGGQVATIPGPRLLHCDIDMDGEVTVVDASQIAAAVGLPPGTLSCLAPGDCSSFQGVGPGLGPEDFAFAQDHFLGTGVLGTPLTDAAHAACDANGDGTIGIPDLLAMYTASFIGTQGVPRDIDCGDCNQDGTVDPGTDANWMFAEWIGFINLDTRGQDACDVNNDGSVDPSDIAILSLGGPLTCDLGPVAASLFGSGTYTISPGSTGTGASFTFLIADSVSGNVVQYTSPGTTGGAAALALAWMSAINTHPSLPFTATPLTATSFAISRAGTGVPGIPGVVAVTSPFCIPGLGAGCRFNGLMVEIKNGENNLPMVESYDLTATTTAPLEVDVLADAWDPEDNLDPGSVEVLGEFQYGNAEVDEDGNVVYTASPDGRSPDTVVFQVCDLEGLCNRGTINIKVVADANQPPVAADDTATTTSGGTVTIAVLDNDFDPDGDPLRVTGVGPASGGTASFDPDSGKVSYVADADFAGTDSFDYTVTDGNGGDGEAAVHVIVSGGDGKR